MIVRMQGKTWEFHDFKADINAKESFVYMNSQDRERARTKLQGLLST